MRLAAMLGDEGVIDDNILAAGAGHPGHKPVVVDLVVFAREQKGAELRHRLSLDFDHAWNRTKVNPLAKVASGRERPSPAEAPSAGHALGFAGRRIGRRIENGWIGTPNLFLRFARIERGLPRMHPEHSEHPAERSLRARDFNQRRIEFPKLDLTSTPPRGLQGPR